MDDERFKLLNTNEIKNKRGRKWVHVSDNIDNDSDESDLEYVETVTYSSDESYVELDENDCSDVDFDDLVKEAQLTSESTNRLAVLHFDFDEFSLSYLALMVKSKMPKNGKIKSIYKYPTQEYMDRYYEEQKLGPIEYLNVTKKFDDDDEKEPQSEDRQKLEKLKTFRKYQISRLKFFVAVFEFDSIETADVIYDSLNDVNIENSGLKIDMRYVDNDRNFHIPDEFLHLVEKLRPNSSKWSSKNVIQPLGGFRSSCFAEINVQDKWDTNRRGLENFIRRALDGTDDELSDVGDYFCEDNISDFCESDSNNDNEESQEKKAGKKLSVQELRSLLGLEMLDEIEDEDQEIEEEYEIEDEVMEVESEQSENDSNVEEDEEQENDSDSFKEEYVIDDAAIIGDDHDAEDQDSEDNDREKKTTMKKRKQKKISQRDKMKSILKEKTEKKTRKFNEVRQIMITAAQEDDRFDEFLMNPKLFKISQTHPKYESVKLFHEMMRVRAEKLEVPANFVVPDMNAFVVDQNKNRKNIGGPLQKRRRVK